MSTKVIATAAIRGINRKLTSSRAALTLVMKFEYKIHLELDFNISSILKMELFSLFRLQQL